MSYSIHKLYLSGIGPFKEEEIIFEDKVYLVTGVNESDPAQKSNGVGKSFILDAIFFALTGDAINCSNSDLINDSGEYTSGFISLELIGKHKILIERTINQKSSTAKLFVDGIEVTDKSIKLQDLSKKIYDYLEITKEDIINYFVISRKYKSFFNQSDTQKLNFLARVINTEKIEYSKNKIKEELKKTQKDITFSQGKLDSLNKMLSITIEEVDAEDIEQIEKLKELISNKESEKKSIEKRHSIKIDKLKKAEKQNEVKLRELNQEIRTVSNSISNKENEIKLKQSISCPSCLHEFYIVNGKEISNSKIESITFDINTLKEKLKNLNDEARELGDVILDTSSNITTFEKENKREVTSLTSEINKLTLDKSILENKIQLIEKRNKKSSLDAESEIKIVENEFNSLSLHYKDLEENQINLSKYQNYSTESILKILEIETNKQLKSIGSNLSVSITFDKKINISVERNLKVRRRPSSGEQARVDICIIFALQSIINSYTQGGGLNFCIIDEIADSLDLDGIYTIIKNIRNSGKTALFITQHELKSNISNQITIVKAKDEFSKIYYEQR